MRDLVQGSDDWLRARAGSVGASQIADLMAKTKSGWGASRETLMARIIAERLTGTPQESYVNAAMQHGTDTEPQARSAYAFVRDADVAEVGLVPHPEIEGTHASPDGLVGDDGLVEIKCPSTATHIDTLLRGTIADRYVKQMQWQMACTGRAWCDFVSFDPRMPGDLQLFIHRLARDEALIAETADAVRLFLMETQARITRLTALRAKPEPTPDMLMRY
jgi:putative phage-type endonuclease